MIQYNVTGMSCAACSARVEKAVLFVPGVESCAVSLLTNSMGVEGTASEKDVIKAVVEAGYGAYLKDSEGAATNRSKTDLLTDTETPKLRRRLFVSLGFLLVLMYISMGHTMLVLPLPEAFASSPAAVALAELMLAAIVMIINQRFFINGFKGLAHRAPNMDTLVALGSSAAFIYSSCVLFSALINPREAAKLAEKLYFESSAMILTLITVGKVLEARSKGKTTDALKALMKISPETATVIRNGEETTVPVEDVIIGDIFVVRPGDRIPVDGIVTEGFSAVDESALTGESVPVEKEAGAKLSAGTANVSGFLKAKAVRVGKDTTLSGIISLVEQVAATKAPIAKIADKVSAVFVPVVMSIAAATAVIWLLAGRSAGFALARGISVLVISCPCALGLATPVAIMVGSGVGAKHGILFKTAESLELTGKIETAVLDKTGTITAGRPVVTDIIPMGGLTADELLSAAAAIESPSAHPFAGAIIEAAEERNIAPSEVSGFAEKPGNGVCAELDGKQHYGGSVKYISSLVSVPAAVNDTIGALQNSGKTPLLFSDGERLLGVIAAADKIKPESRKAVDRLKAMGIKVIMLTGDNRSTAEIIGREAGVDEIIAGVLPDGKESVIRRLSAQGRTLMIGDGINDSPALTRADIGMAIGAGADIAVDSADVVLMKGNLTDAAAAISLSRQTIKNIKENLFWAFFYNTICIPVAAGALVPLGITLNPMLAAAAMSLSSFCVVSNALRLNAFDIYSTKRDKPLKNKDKKEISAVMEKTMVIEGMMCPHCEARVKKTLEALENVESAKVSYTEGTAVVHGAVLDEAVLKKAVTDQGYEVKEIK